MRTYLERLVNDGDFEVWPELIAGETLSCNGQSMSRSDLERMRAGFLD